MIVSQTIDSLIIGGQELWVDDICLQVEGAQARSKILFDARVDESTSYTNFWSEYKSELSSRGYIIHYHTTGEITLTKLNMYDVYVIKPYSYMYTEVEKQAVNDFINSGGSVLVACEFGPSFMHTFEQNILDT